MPAIDHRRQERAQRGAHLDLGVEGLDQRIHVTLVPLAQHPLDELGVRLVHCPSQTVDCL